ncbi:GNAT family N-acetyltransferase [Kiloniella laminariae]|uniref:GNAT family N-acetyltransferase n=1 Tax=Kiloniella laminariae TaxID=454162 RepID=UPI0003AA6B2D
MTPQMPDLAPTTEVNELTEFRGPDLYDLCDATESAIEAGGGFGWLRVPEREIMENHWRGTLLVPGRQIFVARLDGTICGSAQLHCQPRNNEAQAHSGQLSSFFLAPWARGHGLAAQMVKAVEKAAIDRGLSVLNLDVRETQKQAIRVYEQVGFTRWGTQHTYARVNDQWVAGHFYSKILNAS